jgi:N-sulfoglucosamine sulfohydrolase
MGALNRNGLAENTIVIFIGDHGAPFPRAKTTCYDSGLRIPFIVKGPGVIQGVSAQPVSTIDLLPTFLDYAAIPAPYGLPGISLKQHLEGLAPSDANRPLFASHFAHQKDAVFPMRAVRQSDWLLIENLRPGAERPNVAIDGFPLAEALKNAAPATIELYRQFRQPPQFELYNLSEDPYCFANLAEMPSHAARLQSLRAELESWRHKTADMPEGRN